MSERQYRKVATTYSLQANTPNLFVKPQEKLSVFKVFRKVVISSLLLYLTYQILFSLYFRYIRSPTAWTEFSGHWAVVTEATSDLGEGYSYALAKRGLNLILVASNEKKLKEISDGISKRYPNIQTRNVVGSLLDNSTMTKIEQTISNLRVSVLISNGGFSKNESLAYWKQSLDEIEKEIHLYYVVPMQLARLVYPQMQNRDRGRILLVSSITSFGMPFLTTYSSAKGGIDIFAASTSREFGLVGYNIEVMVSKPGLDDVVLAQRIGLNGKECARKVADLDLDYFGATHMLSADLRLGVYEFVLYCAYYLSPEWLYSKFTESFLLECLHPNFHS